MKIEDATTPTEIRSAFCCFCQKDRFKHEMRPVKGPSGRMVKRCIHCLKFTTPQSTEGA